MGSDDGLTVEMGISDGGKGEFNDEILLRWFMMFVCSATHHQQLKFGK